MPGTPGGGGGLRSDFAIGYNLDFPGDWTNQPPFIDLMKNSRAFQGTCEEDGCDQHAHLDLDAAGWPRSLKYKDDPTRSYATIETYVNTSKERYDLGRRFAITWEGNGEMELLGGQVVEDRPNRIELLLGDTLALRLRPADGGMRNIRVFRVDQESLLAQGQLFNPDLLDFLKPFRSLRFMDWMQSNSPGLCSGGDRAGKECYPDSSRGCGSGRCVMPGVWSERPITGLPSLISWGQYLDPLHPERGTRVGGYPLEVLVQLSNAVHAAPHFNMPLLYEDDYVTEFARLVRSTLAPDQKVRVEFSNEVWNWGFPQADYAKRQADRLMPGEGSGWVQFMAGRTARMCALWRAAFAGEDSRLECLISPQTGWRDLAETVLDCPNWVRANQGAEPCYRAAHAIAVSGYFSACLQKNPKVVRSWLREGQAMALDKAFAQLSHGGLIEDCEDSLDRTVSDYAFFADLARERQLGLVVYEGGTHFDYETEDAAADPVMQLFVEMTRDERMYQAYQRNFEGLRAAGGTTFNLWGWVAPRDAWANADTLLDRSHPKYRAAVDFLRTSPR